MTDDTITQDLDQNRDPELEEEEWEPVDNEEPEEEELPARPRNRFLRPLPMGLIAVLIAALAFFGGIQIQKSNGGESSSASPFGSGGVPSFLSEAGGEGGSGSATGIPSFGGEQDSAVTGTVTGVEGKTIYVKNSEGTVVAVRAEDGAAVTRTTNSEAKGIHPGDSVVVQGSKKGSKVNASSIAATASGVELSGTASSGAGNSEAGQESGGIELFGE